MRRGRHGAKRKTAWRPSITENGPFEMSSAIPLYVQLLTVPYTDDSLYEGDLSIGLAPTVLRIVGKWWVAVSSWPHVFPTSAEAMVDVGIARMQWRPVEEFILGGGGTSGLEVPTNDPEYGWMYRERLYFYTGVEFKPSSGDGPWNSCCPAKEAAFDIRSKRKLGPDQCIVGIAQFVFGGVTTLRVDLNAHSLLAL